MTQVKYKTISLAEADYKELDKIRQAWVKKHKANISLAKMIKIAMVEYKTHL